MIRVVVMCDTLAQLETLLLATRAIGLTPDLGVGEEEPRRPSPNRKARSTSKRKRPKRFPASTMVRVGERPEGPPKLIAVHKALRAWKGSEAFRKGDARQYLLKKLDGYSSSNLTALMETGGLIRA